MQGSLNLIYSSNQEIIQYLTELLSQALANSKKAENATLLLAYLSITENLKKILGTGGITNQKHTLEVFEKCREILRQDILMKINKHFKKGQAEEEKNEEKQSK